MKRGILLSGGLDSTALCFWQRPAVAFTVDYGQRAAEAEIRAAARVTDELRVPHEVVKVDCSAVGWGCLSRSTPACPASLCPSTQEWWPFRNQLLVTLAAARAIALGLDVLMIGSVSTDRRHRDGTPEFVSLMSDVLSLQEGGLRLEAPAIRMTTDELVTRSGVPLPLLAWAHSCHVANYACGECPGCVKNQQTWRQVGGGHT